MKNRTTGLSIHHLVSVMASIVLLSTSCSQEDSQKSLSENQELKNRIAVLEQEKSKETAESHYQKGLAFLSTNNYEEAKKEFEIVSDKYPSSPIANDATVKIININTAMEQKGQKVAKPPQDGNNLPDASTGLKKGKQEKAIEQRNESVQLTGNDWYMLGPQGQCVQGSPAEFINLMKDSGVKLRIETQREDFVSLHSPTLNKGFIFIKGENACEFAARMMGK